MSAKSLMIALFASGCVAAAAAGGYVAVRLNTANRAAAPIPADVQTATVPTAVPTPAATEPVAPQAGAATPIPAMVAPSVAGPGQGAHATHAAGRQGAPGEPMNAPSAPLPIADPTPTIATPPTVLTPPVNDPPPVVEPARPFPAEQPPARRFEDLTIKEGAVIGIRLDVALSTETAKIEDKVTAHVGRDVTVDGRTAIPLGARLEGTVVLVQRGGKLKDRARIGVRFETLVLADGTRLPLLTDTIFRDGEPPTGEASSKIGASAVVGAILGAVIGGKKGAAIGGTAGAAGGTAAVMAGNVNAATIPAGTPLTVRLTAPVTVTIERDPPLPSSMGVRLGIAFSV